MTTPVRSVARPASTPTQPRKLLTLADSDYVDDPPPQRNTVCLIFAETGHGKSTFGLEYVPGPVMYHDIDYRGFEAYKKAKANGKKVKYLSLDYPKQISKMDEREAMAAAQKSIDRQWKNLEIAAREGEKGNVRTITWDTGTELAQLANIAFCGRPERQKDDYGKTAGMVKVELAEMVKAVRGKVNLVILAHAKEIWENNKPTGVFTHRGDVVLAEVADWTAHLSLVEPATVKARQSTKHQLKIGPKPPVLITELGKVYNDDDWQDMGPFAYACMMQYMDSEPSDWMD